MLSGFYPLASLAGRLTPLGTGRFIVYLGCTVHEVLRLMKCPGRRGLERVQMVKTQWMLIAGGRIYCRQCQAVSKRSNLQCKAPAKRGRNVCRTHGGVSTGPRTQEGRLKCGDVHRIHGRETRAKRAERSLKLRELYELLELGNAIGLFNTQTIFRGRRPKQS